MRAHHAFNAQNVSFHVRFAPFIIVYCIVLSRGRNSAVIFVLARGISALPFFADVIPRAHAGRTRPVRALVRRVRRLEKFEAQCVQHHEDAGHAHRRGADHRVETDVEGDVEHARREGDAQRVVKERPEEILLDVADGAAREPDRRHDVERIVSDKHDVRALHRYITAAAYGDADVRARKCGCVVYAVAHHRHDALFFELGDLRLFVARQHSRKHRVYARAPRDGFCRTLVVAREHDGDDAEFFELGDGLNRVRFQPVQSCDEPDVTPVRRDNERGLALPRHALEFGGESLLRHAFLRHESGVADGVAHSAHVRTHPFAGQGDEILRFRGRYAALAGIHHHRLA